MKVFIVDDDPKNLDILQTMLESKGYEIISAQNGKTALEIAEINKLELEIGNH